MKGFALIYQMLISMVVLLLVSALLISSRHQVFTSRGELQRLRAQYAAEAGLATVSAQLQRNPSWTGHFQNEPVPGDDCTFTLEQCLNNLRGGSARDSYLGSQTVPPHTALLLISGQASGYRQSIEVFLSGGGFWTQGAALLASNSIGLHDNVYVDGFESLRGTQSVPGSIHSNQANGGVISWSGTRLQVSGTISTVSSASDAIRLGPGASATVQSGAPFRRLPRVNVPQMVSRLAGTPGVPLLGNPVVLDGGTHFYEGLTLDGDLQLRNGAKLVIRGDLTINGSVSGLGALVVDGNVRLFGDSQVSGVKDEYVSVLASRNVFLSGFDGGAYLDRLALSEPENSTTPRGQETAELWSDVKTQVGWLNDFFRRYPAPDATHWADTQVDAHLAVLGQGGAHWGYSNNPNQVDSLPLSPRRNSSTALLNKIQGSGPTQDFLRERFRHLDDLFRASNYTRAGDDRLASRAGARKYLDDMLSYLDGSWDPARSGGLIDIAQSAWTTWNGPGHGDYQDWNAGQISLLTSKLIPDLIRQIDGLDYNRLGAAQFRGLIYARGGILADGEITVVGSMVADGDPDLPTATFHDVSLRPGEIHLADNSRFTYVKEMFEDGASNLIELGVLDVLHWRLK